MTITRVGRSQTVTTPTSLIPAAAARARAYSCSRHSAPPATQSQQRRAGEPSATR